MARKKKNENVAPTENEAPEGEVTEAAADVAQPINPEASTPEAAKKAEPKSICLTPNCGREAKIRGLCSRCGTAARTAIKDLKTTWEKLEALGLAVAPKHKAFGGEPGLFSKALAAKLGDKKE